MNDPYVYSNGILKNKLHIKDYDQLNKAEADIGFVKLIDIDSVPYNETNEDFIKSIHKHIFEDIFTWAGEYRTVPIFKEEIVLPKYSVPYTDPKKISSELKVRLKDLESTKWNYEDSTDLSMTFARKIALMWKVHPFRDGNTRTMLAFSYMFAKKHGFELDMEVFTGELTRVIEDGRVKKYSIRDKFVLACLDEKDYPEVEHLAAVFSHSFKVKQRESEKVNKG